MTIVFYLHMEYRGHILYQWGRSTGHFYLVTAVLPFADRLAVNVAGLKCAIFCSGKSYQAPPALFIPGSLRRPLGHSLTVSWPVKCIRMHLVMAR